MESSSTRVTVVGAGLIGLATAWQLAKRGADVTVVDRGTIGGACSRANTGWVVPALSSPVAAPGSVKQGRQMLLRRDNPFRIKPRPSLELARWLTAFVRSSRPDAYRAGTEAVLALNARTLDLFDELRDDGVAFEMHGGGIIFLCLDPGALAGTEARLGTVEYPGEIEPLDGDAARAVEPSISDAVIGALHIKPERVVRPESLTGGLAAALRDHGARIVENAGVSAIRSDGTTWRVVAGGQDIDADRVVIAAGVWSRDVARQFDLRLPLQPGKGYSLTARGSGLAPEHALFFVEAMIGAAPYDGALRLAGMLELAGMDPRVDPRRVALLTRAAGTYLRDWRPDGTELEWAGLRPLAPDGLPIVGAVPGRPGLFLATGHGMVGLTLAPATAALLAPFVLGGDRPPELAPFGVDRF